MWMMPWEHDRPDGWFLAALASESFRAAKVTAVVLTGCSALGVIDYPALLQLFFVLMWLLEFAIVIVLLCFLLKCTLSLGGDFEQLIMWVWLLSSASLLCFTIMISLVSMRNFFDGHCATLEALHSNNSRTCQKELAWWLGPWSAFLLFFAAETAILKRKLVAPLHATWYVPGLYQDDVARPILPAPTIMFRMTGTYYTRTYNIFLAPCADELPRNGTSDIFSAPSADELPMNSSLASLRIRTSEISMTSRKSLVESLSSHSLYSRTTSVISASSMVGDTSGSFLQLRDPSYHELVENEHLCFVCFDENPDGVLMECGHAGLCVACSKNLCQRGCGCPICRSDITRVLRLRPDQPLPPELFEKCPDSLTSEDKFEVHLSSRPPWPTSSKDIAVVVDTIMTSNGAP